MPPKSDLPPTQTLSFNVLDDIEGDYCNQEITVRLIHYWEARNFKKEDILLGIELLLTDSHSNAVHGFIPVNRIPSHANNLNSGSVYKLSNFLSTPSKKLYKVFDYNQDICFTIKTTMFVVPDGSNNIDNQKFRLCTFKDLAAITDTNTQLFDVIGQIRMLTGDNLHSPTTMEKPPEVEGSRSTDRVLLHLLMKDGETIRIYLWRSIAGQFRKRWNEAGTKPAVLLITTVNPKTNRSAFSVSSTSATRLFFDTDIAETKEFLEWLGKTDTALPSITSSSSAITQLETVTINEIHQYLQDENPQAVSFYCYATIVDFLPSNGWYYISCNTCNTKLGKNNPTSMYCDFCKKENNVGLLRFRFEITVRDKNNDEPTFVVFDEDGVKIAGRRAADVMNETTEAVGEDAWQGIYKTTPQCLKHIIGYTCKFQVKLTPYNFRATRQTITVSRFMETNISQENDLPPENSNTGNYECVVLTTIGDRKMKMKSTNTDDMAQEKKEKRPRLDN